MFGADLIAGFPTETDAMFATRCRWSTPAGPPSCMCFHSARKGTPAALMPQVPARPLPSAPPRFDKGVAALKAHLCRRTGPAYQVLMENEAHGRSADFTPVRLRPSGGAARWSMRW
jgi:threonylcarbamoyladenosine tRNA methylthiotransferase MtaB